MTATVMLSAVPIVEGSISDEVAKAVATLDDPEMSHETNLVGTVIEVDDIDELFAVVGAAHKAANGDHVSTFLEIDDKRIKEQAAANRVGAVEAHLGREMRSDRE